MARITSEDAVEQVGNRFDLVLIASRRVRELRNGYRPHITSKNGALVTALKEIEQGLVGKDYLLKPTEVNNHDRRPRRSNKVF
jgi:DNA-directed RNA polymerase subunit omega